VRGRESAGILNKPNHDTTKASTWAAADDFVEKEADQASPSKRRKRKSTPIMYEGTNVPQKSFCT